MNDKYLKTANPFPRY